MHGQPGSIYNSSHAQEEEPRSARPTKATASTASTAESTTADGKLSVGWLEDSCGFEVKRKYKQGDALVQKALRHHVGCIVCGSNEAVFQYRSVMALPGLGAAARGAKTDWHNFGHKSECGLRKRMIEKAPPGYGASRDGCWSKRQIEDGRRAGDLRGRGGVQG